MGGFCFYFSNHPIVCPQHDVLFEELTAVEHIELYAGLKGVPRIHWPKLIEDRLKCVRLWTVKNARSNTYSGGMKRRLSLIIATIGDPKVMFLDGLFIARLYSRTYYWYGSCESTTCVVFYREL